MAETKFEQAVDYFEKGRLPQAEAVFKELLAQDKKNARIYFYLGSIAFKRDNYDEAIDYLTTSLKLDDSDYRTHEVMGQALGLRVQRAGMVKAMMTLPKSKAAFQKALELNPDALAAREGLFMFYLFAPPVAGGDEEEAKKLVDEIMARNPGKGHLANAIFLAKQKQMDDAEDEFHKAAESGRDDADVQWRVGQFYLGTERLDKALPYFERFKELHPEDPRVYAVQGDFHMRKNELADAVDKYSLALKLSNEFYPARYKRAEALASLGRFKEALKDYQHIVDNHPKAPEAAKAKEALQQLKI